MVSVGKDDRSRAPGIPRARAAWIAGLIVTCLAFVFMTRAKILTLRSAPNFDPSDDTALFWTENAFHYRYAKMVAEGKAIPDVDIRMQYPEGMHVFRDEMPMMERFVGYAFRRFAPPGMRFHVFLLTLVCVYSSLIIFPAYLLAARAWDGAGSGVTAVLFYALTYSFIGPVVLGAFVRQDFALPFLFLGTHFLLAGLESGRWRTWLAAFLTAFAFASWHLSQFYYLVLLTGIILVYFASGDRRSQIAHAVGVMTLVLACVSLFVLPLRSGGFPFSMAMLLSYAFLLAHYAPGRRTIATWKRALVFVGAFILLVGVVTLVFGEHATRYSHVYRLMIDKIRFLGVKPADPSQLSFESRVMWTSSFLSPSLQVMAGWMSGAWVAAAAAAVFAVLGMWRARRVSVSGALILWMSAVFALLFALIHRMDIFASFFVCVLAGRAFPRDWNTRKGYAGIAVIAGLVMFSYWNLTRMYMISGSPPPELVRPLIEEIRRSTEQDDVILASFPLSPVICAYTERPVIIHSKFENLRVREKVEEFYNALFSDEETFFGFCGKYNVKYVVYDPVMLLNLSTESVRYIADRLDLTDDVAAVRMHLLPESLAHFLLVLQNDHYRVFRVLDRPRQPGPLPFAKLPIYDGRRFRREDLRIREE